VLILLAGIDNLLELRGVRILYTTSPGRLRRGVYIRWTVERRARMGKMWRLRTTGENVTYRLRGTLTQRILTPQIQDLAERAQVSWRAL